MHSIHCQSTLHSASHSKYNTYNTYSTLIHTHIYSTISLFFHRNRLFGRLEGRMCGVLLWHKMCHNCGREIHVYVSYRFGCVLFATEFCCRCRCRRCYCFVFVSMCISMYMFLIRCCLLWSMLAKTYIQPCASSLIVYISIHLYIFYIIYIVVRREYAYYTYILCVDVYSIENEHWIKGINGGYINRFVDQKVAIERLKRNRANG